MPLDFQHVRTLLNAFQFHDLFIDELGWSQPSSTQVVDLEVDTTVYRRTRIAEMSGVPVFEIEAPDGEIPKGDDRAAIHKRIAEDFAENLLIFVKRDRTRSLWYWAKREGSKFYPRTESYIKGQRLCCIIAKWADGAWSKWFIKLQPCSSQV